MFSIAPMCRTAILIIASKKEIMTNESTTKPKKAPRKAKAYLPMDEKVSKDRRKPSAKAKKLAARLCAVQGVYQMLLVGISALDAFEQYKTDRFKKVVEDIDFVEADLPLLQSILVGVADGKDTLAEIIDNALGAKRGFDDLEILIKSTMLCGTYELSAHHEYDSALLINDYVEVAKAFFDDKQPGLVNAVLDSIGKIVRP